MKTYDCPPTLTDSQVLEFCRNGSLMLKGVVPEEINRRTTAYLETNTHYEPTEILKEDWFVQNVICHPQAAGAVRSLLGRNFHLPILMSNHRVKCPAPIIGGWHVDGNFDFSPQLNYLQVFYYPQDTPVESGPTEIVPGTHLIKNVARAMAHYGRLRHAVATAAPAGSIFITVYQIWHRRSPSTATGTRNLLKYFYWRTEPPQRDWIREPGFDFATANYVGPAAAFTDQFRDCLRVSQMFCWLCGKAGLCQNLGGQSWPLPAKRLAVPYGFRTELNA